MGYYLTQCSLEELKIVMWIGGIFAFTFLITYLSAKLWKLLTK